jgi:hypothetical protein
MAISFVKNVKRILDKVDKKALVNMKDALFLASIEASRLAPIDTNRLRTNVDRNIFKFGHGNYLGEFIFRQPYAEVQHEHDEFIHPKGGESRYVEKAMRRNVDNIMKLLGRRILS